MLRRLHAPTSRIARRWSRPAAIVLTLAVIGLGAPGSVGTSATAAGPDRPCDRAGGDANARVRPGTAHGSDPNSVSPARAAAIDRALKSSVKRLQRQGRLDGSGHLKAAPKVITIQTHVHVITRTNGVGAVPTSRIKAQIAVLNKAYAGQASSPVVNTGFQFVLASVDVTKNNNWYDWDEATDNGPAKKKLHQGDLSHLNLYLANLGDDLLGYATFPFDTTLKDDGVVILNQSLPGGSAAPFNQGDTATHEVGHWLGLFHTFQDGCVAPGDYVSDTPYQSDGDNIFYCRATDDTCKQPGKDPVHNYMSYGDDPCLDRFSAGQSTRMNQSWWTYRVGGS